MEQEGPYFPLIRRTEGGFGEDSFLLFGTGFQRWFGLQREVFFFAEGISFSNAVGSLKRSTRVRKYFFQGNLKNCAKGSPKTL